MAILWLLFEYSGIVYKIMGILNLPLKVGTFLKIGIVSGEFIFSLQMFTL